MSPLAIPGRGGTSLRPPSYAAAMASSRAAASAGSGTQMTLPSSMEKSIAAFALGPALLVVGRRAARVAARPLEHQVELPGQVGGVADPGAHALPGERRHLVGGVAGEEDPADPPLLGAARAWKV